MSKSVKLNAVIAVAKGIKSRSCSVVSDLYKTIQKPELFEGLVRNYRKLDDGDVDLPSERKVVQFRTKDILSALRVSKSELIDVTAQMEIANTQAKASVWIDGKEILPELPAIVLLPLEKELVDLRTFIEKLPILDHGEAWKPKPDDNTGLWVTEVSSTHRTKKVPKPVTLYEATDKHPAQTTLLQEDIIAGYWDTTKLSGAMKKLDKEAILERVEKLLNAVKQAREEANDAPAPQKGGYGAKIFDYLYHG